MKKKKDLEGAILLISDALEISQSSLTPAEENYAEQELLNKLTEIVTHLLDTNLERLLNALYRIDVS